MTVDEATALLTEAARDDECRGFCVKCGADAYGVEPDARGYACEECGAPAVYGAEELLLMAAAHRLAAIWTEQREEVRR